MKKPAKPTKPKSGLMDVLRNYSGYTAFLTAVTIVANLLTLVIPKIIAAGIDAFTTTHQLPGILIWEFGLAIMGIFIFMFIQNLVQTYASERIARDMRNDLAAKISRQNNATVEKFTAAVLLTNLTSDIDAVKMFVAQAVSTIISSVLLIVGASILLLMTDWKLALVVLLIIPIIGVTFGVILGKVRALFMKGQQVIDWLNKVINESILGSGLIRILNSQDQEKSKFAEANRSATEIGMKILGYFASLIPIISFTASMAVLTILLMGGHFVITGDMTLGSFTAFTGYITILIFPIIMIGFMSNVIARSAASYQRISAFLKTPDPVEAGTIDATNLKGAIEVKNLALTIGPKTILHPVSFKIEPGTRTALVGPTAAGKTQLLSLLVGLVDPTSGVIRYDGQPIGDYDRQSLFRRIGMVFQESVVFSMSLRENIAFSDGISEADLQKAIDTAELTDFVDGLPKKLDTIVSERGTSLSGGQKQRIMLARALALNPQIILLDDFTARVDLKTERKILDNVKRNYPDVTLISVTQKIASIEDYDKILVLMEGELIAQGTHKELLKKSPEYIQMHESQKSTNTYEVSTD